jgi:hypothetical protein
VFPCTTAIFSGSSTPDGRPLLYKHRDTSFLQNKLMYFSDGLYPYIGLINSADSLGNEVWAGCNSTGFAIMNSESYNLNIGDTTKLKDCDGFIMKRALQVCSTVEEFAHLLDTLPKPLGVRANFGVIDAKGGASYFETGNFSYEHFDATDPAIAPSGYLIRTNFSESGKEDIGYGYIRYATASTLIRKARTTNTITPHFLITEVSRSLYHSLLGQDLSENLPSDNTTPDFVFFEDYIPRYSSASVLVVHGVKAEQNPNYSTIWTVLGPPLCTPGVPCWVAGGDNFPVFLKDMGDGTAALCNYSLQKKDLLFPIKKGSGKRYLNLAALLNKNNSGLLQKISPIEKEIFAQTAQFLKRKRNAVLKQKDLLDFYKWLESKIGDLIKM